MDLNFKRRKRDRAVAREVAEEWLKVLWQWLQIPAMPPQAVTTTMLQIAIDVVSRHEGLTESEINRISEDYLKPMIVIRPAILTP